MLKQYRKSFEGLFRFFDILIIVASFCGAYYLRTDVNDPGLFEMHLQFKVLFFANLIYWIFIYYRYNLYASRRFIGFWKESLDLIKASILCFLTAFLPAFYFRQDPLSRLFIVYFWHIQIGSLLTFHFLVRRFLGYIRLRGYNYRQVLIVGRNQRAEKIAQIIEENPKYGIRLLGCVDDLANKNGLSTFTKSKLIGKLEDLENILLSEIVDEVIVMLPLKSYYSEIEKIFSLCEQIGVEVKLPADLFSLKLATSTISTYYGIQVIDFYTSPKMTFQLMAKRLMDVIISSLFLIISAPVSIGVAILIKATSKGPILFTQQRIGYNGRPFTCLKFRSMVENAEKQKKDLAKLNEMHGPVFKIKNDPRVTKVGGFLRKTSIDELPQLINVLKGDMSLVGPRPPVPGEVSEYELRDRRRLSMRPGITCIWQVSGRNQIEFESWMELDRHYIDNWSLWLDIKILAKTIPAVLRRSGAA